MGNGSHDPRRLVMKVMRLKLNYKRESKTIDCIMVPNQVCAASGSVTGATFTSESLRSTIDSCAVEGRGSSSSAVASVDFKSILPVMNIEPKNRSLTISTCFLVGQVPSTDCE